ncbi:OmpA family protein [Aquihabitans sp. G128]|uniref:OmpA family protein n=1 Tax=Aquihabitans sp. G128 TaxID=2849779 RepID=UPI001C22AD43|nr:OmpA family protein [Aquihabitans sp. G128]QXC61224.1 OmpA family protein [Aquihabitans sp. G128]
MTDATEDRTRSDEGSGAAREALTIGSIHPRLDMHGPEVGHLGDRRLPQLGALPYALNAPPERERTPVSPLLVAAAVVAVGGVAAGSVALARSGGGGGGTSTGGRSTEIGAPARTDRTASPTSGATEPDRAPDAAPAPTGQGTETTVDQGDRNGRVAPQVSTPQAWFTGGRLVLAGPLPDRRIAGALVRKAATIVGADNVVDGFTIDATSEIPAALPVVVAEQVRYDTGSSEVTSGYLGLVQAWKAILDAHPNVRMHVTGYADSTGDAGRNVALSIQRARAVAGWMEARGVDRSRFTVDGKGAADPAGDNATVEGRAANRRIQVTLDGLLMA